jgi:hypothetical protein
MPKSRNRKDHKQKVQNRNNVIKGIRRKMEKEYTDMLSKKFEEMQSQMSAMSETEEATIVTEQ